MAHPEPERCENRFSTHAWPRSMTLSVLPGARFARMSRLRLQIQPMVVALAQSTSRDNVAAEIPFMNRDARAGIVLGTVMLMGLMTFGCSSSNSASGSGGATATGSGGSTGTGSGGTGSGGTVGAGGASVPLALVCASTVRNKGMCMTDTDLPCANSCGPSKTGFKNCTCFSGTWDCPKCEYIPGNYSCYKLPVPLAACPADPTDPTMLNLIASGGTCTTTPCTPCGSPSIVTYRDSTNMPKAGYCVCVPGAVPGVDPSKWSCASVSEWPPQ